MVIYIKVNDLVGILSSLNPDELVRNRNKMAHITLANGIGKNISIRMRYMDNDKYDVSIHYAKKDIKLSNFDVDTFLNTFIIAGIYIQNNVGITTIDDTDLTRNYNESIHSVTIMYSILSGRLEAYLS